MRFGVVVVDPNDNKFCDCAMHRADFVVTEDNHFAALKSAGFKPQPLTPDEFIRLLGCWLELARNGVGGSLV